MARPERWIFVDDIGEWKKRCLSTAPVHGNQCENRRKHNKTDEVTTHKSGDLIWQDNGYHEHTEPPVDKKVNDWLTDTVSKMFDSSSTVATHWAPDSVFRPFKDRLGAQVRYGILDETHRFPKHPGSKKINVSFAPDFAEVTTFSDSASTFRPPKDRPGPTSDPIMHSMCTERCGPGCDVEFGAQRAREHTEPPVTKKTDAVNKTFDSAAPGPLVDWWRNAAEQEIGPLLAKMEEYGGVGQALDLVDIGRNIARMASREVDDVEATEIGCAFYAHGKMARIMAAIAEGRQPSDDSWYDLGVYARMAQRTRAAGGWPGL